MPTSDELTAQVGSAVIGRVRHGRSGQYRKSTYYRRIVTTIEQSTTRSNRGDGRISRANLDGTEMEDIVDPGLAGEPNEITLDLINQQIYWTDQASGAVLRANVDGSGIETLTSGYPEPYGIALH